jgi:hypothetical protein
MKTEILKREKRIPQPGECWRHEHSNIIFMCLSINEYDGRLLFPRINNTDFDHIFSVDLKTGCVNYTIIGNNIDNKFVIVEPNTENKTMNFIDK